MTTDGFVVSPLLFPGGAIGELAVNGTINDLRCPAPSRSTFGGFILEEGFPWPTLEPRSRDWRTAAAAAGVPVVTGDTKVVERGKADGCTSSRPASG